MAFNPGHFLPPPNTPHSNVSFNPGGGTFLPPPNSPHSNVSTGADYNKVWHPTTGQNHLGTTYGSGTTQVQSSCPTCGASWKPGTGQQHLGPIYGQGNQQGGSRGGGINPNNPPY